MLVKNLQSVNRIKNVFFLLILYHDFLINFAIKTIQRTHFPQANLCGIFHFIFNFQKMIEKRIIEMKDTINHIYPLKKR